MQKKKIERWQRYNKKFAIQLSIDKNVSWYKQIIHKEKAPKYYIYIMWLNHKFLKPTYINENFGTMIWGVFS